ncbi:MAG: DUF1565 domain-containing protein [Cyanobacteria bacterium RU_5_0]|nr:DUF1565 domain-containing protein [Cyanobacteria bacterium RU_5_0]
MSSLPPQNNYLSKLDRLVVLLMTSKTGVVPLVAGFGLFTAILIGSWGKAIAHPSPTSSMPQILAQLPNSQSPSPSPQSQQLLFVNPRVGNDISGDGSQRSPFRTITHALQVAQANTVIMLATGTYSAETGEVFPLTMKPNVAIQGDPSTQGRGIVIEGGGSFLSPTSAGQNIAILGADQAQLIGVTVTNPNPRGYGLWIESSHPIVLSNTFMDNTHDGVSTVGDSAPLIQSNVFTENGANGMTIFGDSRPEVRENLFTQTGFGINIAENAAPLIINNVISQNEEGVLVQENARPTLRGNRIEGNQQSGLVAIAQSQPNLGTASDPGNNIFQNNGEFDLNVDATNQLIPAYGNQLASDRIDGEVDLSGMTPITAPVVAASSPIVETLTAERSTISQPPPSEAPQSTTAITQLPPISVSPSTEEPSPVISVPPPATSSIAEPGFTARQFAPPNPAATPEISVPPSNDALPSEVPTQSDPEMVEISVPPPHPSSSLLPAVSIAVPPPTTTPVPIEVPVSPLVTQPALADAPQSNSTVDAPIVIPVPPPESSPVSPTSVVSSNLPTPPEEADSSLQADLLPVPDGNAPVGNIGDLPTVNVSRDPLSQPDSSNLGSGGTRADLRYRVIVESSSERVQSMVRSLVPNAFLTSNNGRDVIQVGAFSSRDNAEQAVQLLNRNGLRATIQEIE